MKFLKQAAYIRYVIANLSKFAQINLLTFTESFSQRILENEKGPGTSFPASFFIEFFDKKLFCNIS